MICGICILQTVSLSLVDYSPNWYLPAVLIFPKQNFSVWLCRLEIMGNVVQYSVPQPFRLWGPVGREKRWFHMSGRYSCLQLAQMECIHTVIARASIHLPVLWPGSERLKTRLWVPAARLWTPGLAYSEDTFLRKVDLNGTWVTPTVFREGFPFKWQTIPVVFLYYLAAKTYTLELYFTFHQHRLKQL